MPLKSKTPKRFNNKGAGNPPYEVKIHLIRVGDLNYKVAESEKGFTLHRADHENDAIVKAHLFAMAVFDTIKNGAAN